MNNIDVKKHEEIRLEEMTAALVQAVFFNEGQIEEVEKYLDGQRTKGRILLVIMKEEEPIGEVRFKNITGEDAEIGIIIQKEEYRHSGFGSRAIEKACEYAREVMKLSSLYACILPDNAASRRAFMKNGFEYESPLADFDCYRRRL